MRYTSANIFVLAIERKKEDRQKERERERAGWLMAEGRKSKIVENKIVGLRTFTFLCFLYCLSGAQKVDDFLSIINFFAT